MRGGKSVGLMLAIGLFATGCASSRNVLMFGTNTLIGLKVSAKDSTTQVPELKLGYERTEMVWMPLIANMKEKQDDLDAKEGDGTLYQSVETVTGGNNTDCYSVIATVNGSFSGGAVSGTDGKIAQYFATGLAARELAKVGGAALVNTAGDSPISVEAQKIKETTIKNRNTNIDKIIDYVKNAPDNGQVDSTKLQGIVDNNKAYASPSWPSTFTGAGSLNNFRMELSSGAYDGESLKAIADSIP